MTLTGILYGQGVTIMMQIRSFSAVLAVFALWPLHAQAGDGVGMVKTLTGTARLTHAAAAPQPIVAGAEIAMDDVIETDAGARAIFSFADGAELVMTGKGKLVIDEYVFNPDKKTGNKAALDIFEAAFSYTGGALDKSSKPDVKLNIDYGTIGIRGTKLIGARRNGITWVYLSEGGAVLENTGGKTNLAPGYGTRIRSRADAPAPAYLWGPEEVAWLQRFVDDAETHETPAMASNMSVKELVPQESQRQDMPAVSAPASPAAPTAGGAAAESDAAPARARAADSAPAAEAADAKAKVAARADAQTEIALTRAADTGKDVVITDEPDGVRRITASLSAIVQVALVKITPPDLANAQLRYTAEINAEALNGVAHIEFHVLLASGKTGYVFGRDAPDGSVTAGQGWKTVTGSFAIKPGDVVEQIKVILVIDGKGSILLRNLHLLRE